MRYPDVSYSHLTDQARTSHSACARCVVEANNPISRTCSEKFRLQTVSFFARSSVRASRNLSAWGKTADLETLTRLQLAIR